MKEKKMCKEIQKMSSTFLEAVNEAFKREKLPYCIEGNLGFSCGGAKKTSELEKRFFERVNEILKAENAAHRAGVRWDLDGTPTIIIYPLA